MKDRDKTGQKQDYQLNLRAMPIAIA
ncbi:MAG: hypothetical protein RLZZ574_2753, partial [Cyanobacteriota bacterium]